VPSDNFVNVFADTIAEVRALTVRPILLSETAVGPKAGQLLEIENLFSEMAAYKTLGLVWFDFDQHGGIYAQDWRIEDSQQAEYSFRLGVQDELAPAPSTSTSPGS